MAITDDTIRKIKESIDIVEVIEDFVPLKKKGSNWWALSPFTNEKTPSFAVSPTKGIFKDFSTGKAGDAISFVMEMEGVDFMGAMKYLAKKYGIEVEEQTPDPEHIRQQQEKESLYIVLNYAAQHFAANLQETDAGRSLGYTYLKERGFSQETIKSFGLGYSLDDWHHFEETALSKGYKAEYLAKAGLVIEKEGKRYDRFRGRVMFPIHNVAGKVIGFGARTLKKDDKPKYLNSPESPVYYKSEVLYGIYQAKNAIRNVGNCYLVEGYTDVVSLFQGGIENVVASSGTSLTEQQIVLIKRFSPQVTVLYDGDAAGINASMRGVDLILAQGLDVKVVLFPNGQDPDSYIREVGGDRFKAFLEENAKDFILFKTNHQLAEAAGDPVKKAQVIREIVTTIVKIPDMIKRSVFYKQCSDLLGIEEELLIEEGDKIRDAEAEKAAKRAKRQEQAEHIFPGPPPDMEAPDLTEILAETERAFEQENSEFYQEQEFARLLIAYGCQELEKGLPLYQYMREELGRFEINYEPFKKIWGLFLDRAGQGHPPTDDYFIHHDSEEIKQSAIDLLAEKYFISENWEKKYKIFVPGKDKYLTEVVYSNMLRLKYRKTQRLCEEVLILLKGSQTIEAQAENQKLYLQLKQEQTALAKALGTVVS